MEVEFGGVGVARHSGHSGTGGERAEGKMRRGGRWDETHRDEYGVRAERKNGIEWDRRNRVNRVLAVQ